MQNQQDFVQERSPRAGVSTSSRSSTKASFLEDGSDDGVYRHARSERTALLEVGANAPVPSLTVFCASTTWSATHTQRLPSGERKAVERMRGRFESTPILTSAGSVKNESCFTAQYCWRMVYVLVRSGTRGSKPLVLPPWPSTTR